MPRPPPRPARLALRVARTAALAYVCAVVLLAALQRRMLFPAPPPAPIPPGRGALIDRRDARGTRFVAHHVPARGLRTLVFFHGNGDQLAGAVQLGGLFTPEGFGFYAVEYPGYGPMAGGSPSEESLFRAADAALVHLRDTLQVPAAQTVLIGQSLGTGVAVEMARRGHGGRVALLSPFLSVPDAAAVALPWAPVRWLVRDRFDSASRAPSVAAPALVVHGTIDTLIPAAQGAALARRFPRGRFVPVPGAGHNDLWSASDVAVDAIRAFARE